MQSILLSDAQHLNKTEITYYIIVLSFRLRSLKIAKTKKIHDNLIEIHVLSIFSTNIAGNS